MSRFPTRQFPYSRGGPSLQLSASDPFEGIAQDAFVRFVLGRDEEDPSVIDTPRILDHVNDPFATIVLAAGHRPQTLGELLDVLDKAGGPDAVPGQRIYRIADGGQIPWSEATASIERNLRVVVTRHRHDQAELFISTAPPFSSSIFLQVFAWDPKLRAYNFYERRRRIWSWAGSSWDALEVETRGRGPFDSHVNGGPVMKELKVPWMHWHSQAAQIRDDILAPDDPLRGDAFYHSEPPTGLRGGEDLEPIVKAGIARWTAARFEGRVQGRRLVRACEFLRQVLTTTTVNLTTSGEQSAQLEDGDIVRLPATFFVNTDALIDTLGLPVALPKLKAAANLYLGCLSRYAVQLQDRENRLDQDSFFAFAVPEPSFEDIAVLRELLTREVLSRRLALCWLMVDFSNPIFSSRRDALLAYCPDEIELDGGGTLESEFADAVRSSAAAKIAGSPEAEFLDWWERAPDRLEAQAAEAVETYWAALGRAIATDDGFDGIFRLAEFRRRQFKDRPIAEFGLTLPVATAIESIDPLRMRADGTIEPDKGG